MSIDVIDQDGSCRLVFAGQVTFAFARELEDRIIDALRRYTRFEVDLSAISEIDLCGLHLLRVLDTVGGDNVKTVADSSLVEQARRQLLVSRRSAWLRGSREEQGDGRDRALAA